MLHVVDDHADEKVRRDERAGQNEADANGCFGITVFMTSTQPSSVCALLCSEPKGSGAISPMMNVPVAAYTYISGAVTRRCRSGITDMENFGREQVQDEAVRPVKGRAVFGSNAGGGLEPDQNGVEKYQRRDPVAKGGGLNKGFHTEDIAGAGALLDTAAGNK